LPQIIKICCYLVASYCFVLFKHEKLAHLIKSFLVMPNMPLFTGIGKKCNKDDTTTVHERGTTRGGCATRGGSFTRDGGPSDGRWHHNRRRWLDERRRRWWTGGNMTASQTREA
jgi:hypothetical protein